MELKDLASITSCPHRLVELPHAGPDSVRKGQVVRIRILHKPRKDVHRMVAIEHEAAPTLMLGLAVPVHQFLNVLYEKQQSLYRLIVAKAFKDRWRQGRKVEPRSTNIIIIKASVPPISSSSMDCFRHGFLHSSLEDKNTPMQIKR